MNLSKYIPTFFFLLFLLGAMIILVLVPEFRQGIIEAFALIASGNPEIVEITLRSIYISGTATALAVVCGVPMGLFIGLKDFFGKHFLKGLLNALIGIPTVALGLVLYLMFSSTGPLGSLNLFLSPLGVMIGQAILITPIMASFTASAIEAIEPDINDLAKTLGASEVEAAFAVLKESTAGVSLAIVGSFNRAIAELGIALMIGQNIRGETRILTTTIAMETAQGEIALSIALAIILLTVVLSINLLVNLLQRRFK